MFHSGVFCLKKVGQKSRTMLPSLCFPSFVCLLPIIGSFHMFLLNSILLQPSLLHLSHHLPVPSSQNSSPCLTTLLFLISSPCTPPSHSSPAEMLLSCPLASLIPCYSVLLLASSFHSHTHTQTLSLLQLLLFSVLLFREHSHLVCWNTFVSPLPGQGSTTAHFTHDRVCCMPLMHVCS